MNKVKLIIDNIKKIKLKYNPKLNNSKPIIRGIADNVTENSRLFAFNKLGIKFLKMPFFFKNKSGK
ncbi:MAG: hypothetical protein ACFFC3_00375 [Candidatus Odinarchaeota archaeon]